MLKALTEALDTAQSELADAEVALLEAKTRQSEALEAASRLEAAVAALNGESPPATEIASVQGEDAAFQAEDDGSSPSRSSNKEETPEEFDARRKRRQRKRQKELDANNPLAHVKCGGCGTIGSMQDQVLQAASGAPVRMMVCTSCGNQLMQ